MNCDLILTAADLEADREKWLEIRRGSLGGSDAAAVMGLSPWKSPYTLWLEKTGQAKEEDISDRESVHFGNVLEEVVAREFCQREGKKVKRCGLYRSREYPFMVASFDRLLIGENAGLEIKTAAGWKGKQWDAGEIPPPYYLQCLHYMAVSGFSKWYIAALIGGNHFTCWQIDRNEEDIKALLEAEKSFWDKVQRGVMPEIDGSESTAAALKARYGGGGEAIDLPNKAAPLLTRWDELKKLKAGLDAEAAEIQNQLCAMLGDAEIGLLGEGEQARKVSWKSYPGRVTIDSKKLKADLPEIYEKYSKQGSSYRRFTA